MRQGLQDSKNVRDYSKVLGIQGEKLVCLLSNASERTAMQWSRDDADACL